jgi:hypothetical protein
MQQLSQNKIDFLEKFILKNEKNECINCLSIQNGLNGIEMYKQILQDPPSTYKIFGETGMGYTCYSIYKSHDNIIYFICVNMQTPEYCCKINNINFFKKFIH